MAIVLTDQRIFMDGYELTARTNAVALDYSAEMKDGTCYSNHTKVNVGGLKTVQLESNGYVDDTLLGSIFFDKVGMKDVVVSVSADDSGEGDTGYMLRLSMAKYSPGAQIGELYAYSMSGMGSNVLVRGTLLIKGSKSATGNGSAFQLGAVASTKKLHASLHVLSVSGTDTPTLAVKIQSDNASNFPSPADKITFASKTAIGAEYKTADGAITDDYFRVNYTLTGTSPVFSFVVFVGIL